MLNAITTYLKTKFLNYKTPHCVGIDLSLYSIAIASLNKNTFTLNNYHISNIYSPGKTKKILEDIEYIGNAIKSSYKLSGASNKHVSFAISHNLTINKNLILPKTNSTKLDELVESTLQKEFNNSEFEYDYQIINQGIDTIELKAVVARREHIDEYCAVAQIANLDLCAVDVDVYVAINSLSKLFNISTIVKNQDVLVFDLQLNRLIVIYFLDKKYVTHLEIMTNYAEQIISNITELHQKQVLLQNQIESIFDLLNVKSKDQVELTNNIYNDVVRIFQLLSINLINDKKPQISNLSQVMLLGFNSLNTSLELLIKKYFNNTQVININQVLLPYNPNVRPYELTLLFPAISLAIKGSRFD